MSGPHGSLEPSLSQLINHSIFAESSNSTTNSHQDTMETPRGLQNLICIRNMDIIVAVGIELRMMPLQTQSSSKFSYKRLTHSAPKFPIRQIRLNPNGKLLAIASSHDVTVVALPRQGYFKSLSDSVECRSVSVGSFYHNSSLPPIAKVDWHPWGENGSTLLVLSVDGTLREYDTSVHPDLPQQTLQILSNKSRSQGFNAYSDHAASFTVGQGINDWGSLTLLILTANGEVYGICPYLPRHVTMPTKYIENLESHVNARMTGFDNSGDFSNSDLLATLECQRSFVKALTRQASDQRLAAINPEMGIKEITVETRKLGERTVAIQGPYLFRPVPHELEDSEGGEATDLKYLSPYHNGSSTVSLSIGVLFIAFQDGKVDICLDLQKLEGRWATPNGSGHSSPIRDLPILHVYESVDLGRNKQSIDVNFPCLTTHPSLSDMIFISHCFGVHCVSIAEWITKLDTLMGEEWGDARTSLMHSDVRLVHSTFSEEERCAFPVVGLTFYPGVVSFPVLLILSNEPRLSILSVLPPSKSLRILANNRTTSHIADAGSALSMERGRGDSWLNRSSSLKIDSDTHVSLLAMEPYTFNDILYQRITPLSLSVKGTVDPTPGGLRTLVKLSEGIRSPIQLVSSQIQALAGRIEMQEEEQKRQLQLERELISKFGILQDGGSKTMIECLQRCTQRRDRLRERIDRVQKALMLASSPELSLGERKWFSEIDSVRKTLHGSAQWDANSLCNRTQKMSESLKEVQALRAKLPQNSDSKYQVHFRYISPRPKTWGTDQVHRYINKLQYLHSSLQVLQAKTIRELGGGSP